MKTAKPRGRRRWLRRSLWIATGLVVLVGLGLGALTWRLHQGPIRVDFLEPLIEQAVDELVAPVRVTLGGTTLNWVGGDHPAEVRANGVVLTGPDGNRLVSFAEIGVGLHRPALLRGNLSPTSLTFRRTHAVVRRLEDGSFDFGFGNAHDASPAAAGSVTRLLHQWLDPHDPDQPLARLSRISILDSRVEFHDAAMGLDWGADRVEATFYRREQALDGELSLWLRVGEHDTPLNLKTTYAVAGEALDVHLQFTDLIPAAFARSHPALETLTALDDPIDGTVEAHLAGAVRLERARLNLTGSPGSISGDIEFSDDYANVSGTVETERLAPWIFAAVVPELGDLARIRLPIDATIVFDLADESLTSLEFDLRGGAGTIAIPEAYPNPLQVSKIHIVGSARDDLDRLTVSRLIAELPDVTANATLVAERRGQGYRVDATAGIHAATLEQVAAYWPPAAGSEARTWVIEQVPSGNVSEIELATTIDFLPGATPSIEFDSFVTTFGFDELRIDPLQPQPAIEKLTGRASMTLERLDFAVTEGNLLEIALDPSTVSITGLAEGAPAALELDLALRGPVSRVNGLLSAPPLSIIPPDLLTGLTGDVRAGVEIVIPLEEELTGENVRYSAVAELDEIRWTDSPVPLGQGRLSGGPLDLRIDRESVSVQGTIALDGIPARVDYRENLSGSGPSRHVVAHATLDDEARRALGLPEQDYLTGATILDLTYTGRRDGSSRIVAAADLTGNTIAVPELGWNKVIGEAGRIETVLETTEERWIFDPLEIDADGMKFGGSMEFAAGPLAFRELRADLFVVGDTNLHGSVASDPSTGLRVRVEGPRFDAVPLIQRLKRIEAEAAEMHRAGEHTPIDRPPFDFDIRFDNLRIVDESDLKEVVFDVKYNGDRFDRIDIRAEMKPPPAPADSADLESTPPDGRLRLSFLPDDAGAELRFEADNLGLLVDGLQVSTDIRGGTVVLTATRESPDQPAHGELSIRDFTVLNLPSLAKVLEISSLRGMADGLSKEGLFVKKVTASFSGDRTKIAIPDGKVLGRGFGITIRGTIDFQSDIVDLKGAITPMETIQRVIGHLPLIGRLLAGWNREGIIAVLYTVKGPIGKPEVDVHETSILTPGITREIHRLAPDDEEAAGKKKKARKKHEQED